jgi:hypothetical protein
LQGWYAEKFGPAIPSTALVLNGRGKLPAQCGFAVVPQSDLQSPVATVVDFSENSVDVHTGRERYRLALIA